MSFVSFEEFYGVWSSILTETCLPRLSSTAVPAFELSGNIKSVLGQLAWYYKSLNHYANNDSKTILYLLFPPCRNTLEMPILFLGDIHPYFLTRLLRSLIIRAAQDSGGVDTTVPQDPHAQLLKKIEEIEGEIWHTVSDLQDRMSHAQINFSSRFLHKWVNSHEEIQTVVNTAASVAKEEMYELVRVFVDANRLREKVISAIVKATKSDQILTALFLDGVCRIFAAFQDQGQEFHNALWASPLMNNHHLASEPGQQPYQAFPVMNQLPTPGVYNNDDAIPEYAVYVGNLRSEVTPQLLGEKFREHYQSVRAAEVAFFRDRGRSKGYGFVSFSDLNEQRRAMTDMNGQLCYDKPMRIGPARRMPRSNEAFESFTWN